MGERDPSTGQCPRALSVDELRPIQHQSRFDTWTKLEVGRHKTTLIWTKPMNRCPKKGGRQTRRLRSKCIWGSWLPVPKSKISRKTTMTCKHRIKEISRKVVITFTFNVLHQLSWSYLWGKDTWTIISQLTTLSTTSRRVFMGQASQLFSWDV